MPLTRGLEPRLNGHKLGEFLTFEQVRSVIQSAVESLPADTNSFTLEIVDHSKGEFIRVTTLQECHLPTSWDDRQFYHWLSVSGWDSEA
ncbi:MAG: hypothetical protein H6935_15140 [Thiobacillus sp.]|nr:hypothetical protein [Thiobacillus sp.]